MDKIYSKLKKENAKAVEHHLNLAKDAIKLKKDLLDGKIEELGERMSSPRDEIAQILEITKKIDDVANEDLCAELIALEYNARRLVESIDNENAIMSDLKKGAKKTGFDDIIKEADTETFLADVVNHQLSLLYSIKGLTTSVIRKAKGEDFEELVGENIANLDNIADFIVRVILEEEYPNLQIAYNMLELEGWPELMQKIEEIRTKFMLQEPNLL